MTMNADSHKGPYVVCEDQAIELGPESAFSDDATAMNSSASMHDDA